MLSETEKLLGTLEVITFPLKGFYEPLCGGYQTFFWDASKSNFNLWNLIIFEEDVKANAVESVIKGWLKEEQTHSIAPHDTYSLDETDLETLIDDKIKTMRTEKYYSLLQLLHRRLQKIEGFSFHLDKGQEYFYGIIGKLNTNSWVAISTSMPHRHSFPHWLSGSDFDNIQQETTDKDLLQLKSDIQKIINELPPFKLAIPYPAGYGYTYNYKLYCGVASTKSAALIQAMLEAKAFHLKRFQDLLPDYHQSYYNDDSRRKTQQILSKFFKQFFSEVRIYHLALYDIDYTYILGQVAGADWLGVRISRSYEYNP
ncbi:hypothetical protein NIES4071_60670 [Calothrix sp. NIES-4071]|nr:hypothetical protein NIES4071_60670 [Calothrix sp. NIES-4071]BAZ60374.1 hypothetical protein NIES4105_60620 [Calothrix sp. NIES-4105]